MSVLLPVFNGMPYVIYAIDSILKQSMSDFELIVMDDASFDGTSEYLSSLRDERVRVLRTQKSGLVKNLNVGLSLCEGNIVARMDADDISHTDRLSTQLDYLLQHPDCVAVGCQCEIIDKHGMSVGKLAYEDNPEFIRFLLSFCNPLPHPGVMMKRNDVLAVGGYDPLFFLAEDYQLWCKLSTRGYLVNLPKTLLSYRRHGNNITSVMHDKVSEVTRSVSHYYLSNQPYLFDRQVIDHYLDALNRDAKSISYQQMLAVYHIVRKLRAEYPYSPTLRTRIRWFLSNIAKKPATRPLGYVKWKTLSWLAEFA